MKDNLKDTKNIHQIIVDRLKTLNPVKIILFGSLQRIAI